MRFLTLNVLNTADRWIERLPLLRAEFLQLAPDVVGFQEILFAVDQERRITDGTAEYEVFRVPADRPERGNSLLIRLSQGEEPAAALKPAQLGLGHGRAAVTVETIVEGARLRYVVTHLHHMPSDEEIRAEQVAQLLAWLNGLDAVDGTVVLGDFNAEPSEPAAQMMVDAGFRSAMVEAAGADPERTFPSGLVAPDRAFYDNWPVGCIDYIWLSGAVTARGARVCFDMPAANDPTLFPSDHFGIVAEIVVTGSPALPPP